MVIGARGVKKMTNTKMVPYNPQKCTLTRIIDDFENQETYKERYMPILKNYVYVPQKKLIA